MKKGILYFIILLCNAGFSRGHIVNHVLGRKLILDCKSFSKVHCIWKFGTKFFKFSNRHSYLLNVDGSNTTDCSLEFKPFLEIDAGNWSCWRLSDNFQDGHLLNFFYLVPDRSYHKNVINPFPKNVTSEGEDVVLPCMFNERIGRCNWLRNSDPVVIKNRYRYTNNAEGHYSTDCSIEISSVQDIDLGVWQCSSTSNGRIGYVQSEPAWLALSDPRPSPFGPFHQTPIIEMHPTNQTAKTEGQITMNCKFDQLVHCKWLRNGQMLEIHYKFQYLDKNNGKSKDCSISFANINALDFGSWQCLSAADDKMPAVKSKIAFLADKDIVDETIAQIIEVPENITTAKGHSVLLTCKFDMDVDCLWQRNGIAVLIDQRYEYISEENGANTTDCSLKITSVENKDFGRWTCGFLNGQKNADSLFQEAVLQQMKLPSLPKIRIGTEFLGEVELFSPKTIRCLSSNGYPAAHLSWELNGQRISGNILQEFDELGQYYNTTLEWSASSGIAILQNSTELQCVAEHPFLNETVFASVKIRKTKMPSSPVIIQDGREINISRDLTGNGITCTSLEGHPAPKLFWLFDGQRITGITENQSSGERKLINATLHWNTTMDKMLFLEDANVSCVAEHPDFQRAEKATLRIKPLQRPVIQLHNIFISTLDMEHINESTALSCISEFGKYEPKMHWECDGEKVSSYHNAECDDCDGKICILFWNATFDQTSFKCEQNLSCVAEHWYINLTLESSVNLTRDNPVKETVYTHHTLVSGIFFPFLFAIVIVVTLVVMYCLKRYHGKVYFKYIINADRERIS